MPICTSEFGLTKLRTAKQPGPAFWFTSIRHWPTVRPGREVCAPAALAPMPARPEPPSRLASKSLHLFPPGCSSPSDGRSYTPPRASRARRARHIDLEIETRVHYHRAGTVPRDVGSERVSLRAAPASALPPPHLLLDRAMEPAPRPLARPRLGERRARCAALPARACESSRAAPASSPPAAIAARTAQPGSRRACSRRMGTRAASAATSSNAAMRRPVGQLHLADPGRVDQRAAGRQPDQLRARRRVSAALVVLAHPRVSPPRRSARSPASTCRRRRAERHRHPRPHRAGSLRRIRPRAPTARTTRPPSADAPARIGFEKSPPRSLLVSKTTGEPGHAPREIAFEPRDVELPIGGGGRGTAYRRWRRGAAPPPASPAARRAISDLRVEQPRAAGRSAVGEQPVADRDLRGRQRRAGREPPRRRRGRARRRRCGAPRRPAPAPRRRARPGRARPGRPATSRGRAGESVSEVHVGLSRVRNEDTAPRGGGARRTGQVRRSGR